MSILQDRAIAARLAAWRTAIDNIVDRIGQRPMPMPFLVALAKHADQRPSLPGRTLTKVLHRSAGTGEKGVNPLDLDLFEVSEQLHDGRLSVEELTELSIERLGKIHNWTNAVERLDVKGARAQARHADASHKADGMALQGPLWGLPMAHKSMIYRDSFPSVCGSNLGDLLQPQETATVLGALDRAGSVCLGQLHMTELAFDPTGSNAWLGDCRNPWQPDYVPGGSSSGSAVAVATRCIFGSLGSDTAGSIRIPSALCGVTGLKPTYGRVSRHGTMPLSDSHDHIGPIARTAEDCSLIFKAIAGPDPHDPSTSLSPRAPSKMAKLSTLDGIRVGVPARFFRDGIDKQICLRLDESLKVLESHGAIITEVPDYPYEEVNALSSLMIRVEAGAAHRKVLDNQSDRYSSELAGWLRQADEVSALLYETARNLRGKLLTDFMETVMKDVNVLHVPVIRVPTPTLASVSQGGENTDQIRIEMTCLSRPFSYLGLPALSVPCGFTQTLEGNKMPTAFQLIGHPFDEETILAIGDYYQQVTDWHRKNPLPHLTSIERQREA